MSISQETAIGAPVKPSDSHKLSKLLRCVESKIIGQKGLIENMLVCLLANGHILLEGMPGIAKTRSAKALAEGIEADFHRIQFTPDLLPSDLIGTEIYIHEKSNFIFRRGPLFNNILLADEINRAPAKVQSALLEAMEEKQVTIGHESHPLPELYMVIATQNPIEHEGTYNLPEAQLDRFMMHIEVGYPNPDEELLIVHLDEEQQKERYSEPSTGTTIEEVLQARRSVSSMYISETLKKYAVSLVNATRYPAEYDRDLASWIAHGVSPRASLALIRCSKALAWLRSDEFVSPTHIHAVAPQILRHRLIPSFESEANGISRNAIVKKILEVVAIP